MRVRFVLHRCRSSVPKPTRRNEQVVDVDGSRGQNRKFRGVSSKKALGARRRDVVRVTLQLHRDTCRHPDVQVTLASLAARLNDTREVSRVMTYTALAAETEVIENLREVLAGLQVCGQAERLRGEVRFRVSTQRARTSFARSARCYRPTLSCQFARTNRRHVLQHKEQHTQVPGGYGDGAEAAAAP